MSRYFEPLAFLGLATALHAGAFVTLGRGGAASEEGGEATVVLQAAGDEVATLVAQWERPPEVISDLPSFAAPAMPQAPALPARATAPAFQTPAALPTPALEAPPDPDISQPAARPDPVRPRPRSERRAPRPVEAAATPRQEQPRQTNTSAGQQQAAAATQARRLTAGQLQSLEAEWGATILSRIARQQRYPQGRHGTATVRVQLTVSRDGRLQAVGLSASSGSQALDRAALDAVRRAGRFPAAPQGLTKASYTFRVPMTFRQN